MNSDSESLQHYLLGGLLATNVNKYEKNLVDCEENDGVNTIPNEVATSNSGDADVGGIPQTFQLGEIPTVQERFQAILKRRLQIQIEEQPPLFPWETQLVDYPDRLEERSLVLTHWGWIAQQSKLNLPVTLPEKIFGELLSKCQGLLTSSLPLGAKLVQVVENLFPNESQTVNDIAGLVLRTPYRSADTLDTMPHLQSDYSDLGTRQQMAVSLLAAKQLLDNLTLPVSPSNPVVERLWLTSVGALTLKVEYQSQGEMTYLRVKSELPTQGILTLRGHGTLAMAESSIPGCLSVEICSGQLHPTYTLEVEFPELEQQPLLFVINPTI